MYELLSKDRVVLRYDDDHFELVDSSILPYQLRGRIRDSVQKNIAAIRYFVGSRLSPLNRKYVRQVFNNLRISQQLSDAVKSEAMLRFHALSLQDCYWVRATDEDLTWDKVNLFDNPWESGYADFLLWGDNKSLAPGLTPEMTTDGTYAKCWIREGNEIGLLKRGEHGDTESKAEVVVSHLLDKLGYSHVPYRKYKSHNSTLCYCPLMTSKSVSRLTGMDFISYCRVQGKDGVAEAMKLDSTTMYQMFITDYLFSNSDRHGGNWGFEYDSDTMEILRCHPLYDHNNAFDTSLMAQDDGGGSLFYKSSMRVVAMEARNHIDMDLKGGFTPFDFDNLSQFMSFKKRYKYLK